MQGVMANGSEELLVALQTPSPRGHLGIPALVWGRPGVGKSSFVESLGEPDLPVVTIIASIHDPTDFSGLPVREDGHMRFLPPAWTEVFDEARAGILFLDELTTAPPSVQSSVLRVVLERVVGPHALREHGDRAPLGRTDPAAQGRLEGAPATPPARGDRRGKRPEARLQLAASASTRRGVRPVLAPFAPGPDAPRRGLRGRHLRVDVRRGSRPHALGSPRRAGGAAAAGRGHPLRRHRLRADHRARKPAIAGAAARASGRRRHQHGGGDRGGPGPAPRSGRRHRPD